MPVSRGNYLVTGLIVRRLVALFRGILVYIPFRLAWRLLSLVCRCLFCARGSCCLDEQFLVEATAIGMCVLCGCVEFNLS
jgi:hypothetical protein